jgi:hypothetical protein
MSEEPNKIRAMADDAATSRKRLEEQLETAQTRREKADLRSRIANLRQIENFMRSRAGYR